MKTALALVLFLNSAMIASIFFSHVQRKKRVKLIMNAIKARGTICITCEHDCKRHFH